MQSKSFTPTVAGTYTWSVTFAGDVNNNGPITAGSAGESVTLSPASPTISTLASAGGTVGSTSVHDTAMLSGGYNETGNIIFTLENGSNATVFSDTESASANSAVQSKSFTPTVAGTYTWSVTFAGDVNNNGPITAGTPANR